MAVSSSTDFASTGAEIIADALARMGVLPEEEPLQAYELVRGLRVLTQMLKAWEADGIGTWHYTEDGFALVASDKDYLFGTGGTETFVPFEIVDVRVSLDGGSEIPMQRLSRGEYYQLPNRTSEGFPTCFFYDRQRDNGTLYVWPVPNTNDYDITYTYRRRIMDMDGGANHFDLPPEWEEAIVNNLAERLLGSYEMVDKPVAAKIIRDAATSYAIVKNFDIGEGQGSVFILPDDN